MTSRAITVAGLTLVWMALWESFTLANLVGGLGVAVLAVHLVPLREVTVEVGFRPIPAAKLMLFFLWKLTEASLIVAWEVLTPTDRSSPAVIRVPLRTTSPGIATLVANMVSLTPGTLTLDIDPDSVALFIHVLHFESTAKAEAGVHQLERFALAAFPTRRSDYEGTPEIA